jgi:PAS domain S-box-containing protein
MEPHRTDPTLPGFVQEALSRIGSLLDTLFESAEDAIVVMDGNLRVVDCNPGAVRMFGLSSKAELVGTIPSGEFAPRRQPDGSISFEKSRRMITAALGGVPQHHEWRHLKRDRTEFDVDVRINRFLVDGMPFLVGVLRDITARKRAEAALKNQIESDELLNRILARFANSAPSELDAHMVTALEEVAAFLNVDHAYFLITSPDRTTFSCTHETTGPGVASLRASYQDVPVGSGTWIEQGLRRGEIVKIDSSGDEAHLADVGRRSLLLVPTSGASGEFAGALGVDSHTRQVSWTDADVRLCRIVGNAFNGMSERKRAYERLLQEKHFSERFIDSLPGVFYLYDSNLRLARWNKNQEEVLGYGPDELRGMKMEDLAVAGESRERVLAAALRVLSQGGAPVTVELELRRKDGSAVPHLCSGARIDSPSGPMLVGVGIDITARKTAEKELAASERNYRELFDSTNDALFIHDESGRVLDVNERACVLFGFERSMANRLTIGDLSGGEPPYTQRDALEKIRRAGQEGPQVFDWRSRRRDGTLFWSEVALRAFELGGERRLIASVRDITERKLAGLERDRLMAELQAANAAKDQFLAVLSHELRNPLAAIQAGVDLLRRLTPDDPRFVAALDRIDRNVKLQARLVGDLLDLSRLVRGKLTLERTPLKLDTPVLSAVETCRPDAARAGVSLEAHADPGIWVDADADRIQQVVINLVGNGIKFTPRGGSVNVSVSAKEPSARVTVQDTGVGIASDRLSDLFEMFRQGEIAARRAPGLGIGLAVVKSIVELHGGSVWVESDGHGRGSRFTVELPLVKPPEPGVVRDRTPPPRERIRMLLVEDNADTRILLGEALAQYGYEVTSAESAEEALSLLAREPVDVILSDIGLPGMDGYEFLRQVRRIPSAAGIPAFALTGFGRESDARRAEEVGYSGHFVKPFDVELLDRTLRSRLARPAT